MLTSDNTGKYLTKKHLKRQSDAIWDSARFNDYELDDLDVAFPQGFAKQEDKTLHIDSDPIDKETKSKKRVVNLDEDPLMLGQEGR